MDTLMDRGHVERPETGGTKYTKFCTNKNDLSRLQVIPHFGKNSLINEKL